MDVRVALWRRLSAEELMLLNCGVGEDSWEFLELQGDQPWDFFGRNDAKAETPVLWPPYAKSWLIGKDSDAGRDWGQEEWQRIRWLVGIMDSMDVSVGEFQGLLMDREAWRAAIHGVAKSRTRLCGWTELSYPIFCLYYSTLDSLQSVFNLIYCTIDYILTLFLFLLGLC